MKWENIELFLNYYDYFTKNEIDFIKEINLFIIMKNHN